MLCGQTTGVFFWIAQDLVMQRIMELEHPLLEDDSMLESLQTCQANVTRNQAILDESSFVREQLEEKRAHLIEVVTHGAKLYEIIQRVSVLNPLYHTFFPAFLDLFKTTLQKHNRGKESTGRLRLYSIATLASRKSRIVNLF